MNSGFACTSCHGKTKVIDSRASKIGNTHGVRRRRECIDCRIRFTSVEAPENAFPGMLEAEKELERIRTHIRMLTDIKDGSPIEEWRNFNNAHSN